ncbi:hypothetical protein [Alkalibacillus silvisoli]|uniref:ABC transporter permease n=1 Tax=Alkalibacillus silvisoli TaxID=392823 RepID=A0ABN1A5N3_9BACI
MYRHWEITKDLYKEQLKWSLWLIIGVTIIRYILLGFYHVIGFEPEDLGHLLSMSIEPTKIFMLIIGLLSVYVFLTFFVQTGITRKEYYYGTAYSAIGLAITIPLIFLALFGIEGLFVLATPLELGYSHISFSGLVTELIAYILAILFYFVIGWFITSGFYRYGWLKGLGFIFTSILIVMINGAFWGEDIEIFELSINFGDIPFILSATLTIVLTLILMRVNRILTRDIKIKM